MPARTLARTAGIALVAAAASGLAGAGAGAVAASDARDGRWARANYRGSRVTLGGGVGAVAGSLAGVALLPSRLRKPAALIVVASALAGGYDDLLAPAREQATDKGLAGHLGALRSGRPSGGVVKAGVIGAASVAAVRMTGARGIGSVVGATALAATANVINLLDLRPGRAAKAAVALAGPLVLGPSGSVAAVAGGAALGGLPADLGERAMLGDLGANTVGALLGLRIALLPPVPRTVAAAIAVGLNIASERVSFSAVIARAPWLDRFDRWGRTSAMSAERP